MKRQKQLNIVADRNIPFLEAPLSLLGNVTYLPGDAITPEVMRDTDILLTRTRTKCNAALLDGSRCSFVGTATIGTDHIDLGYCASCGITVANAPGCNAPAVAQYVLAAMLTQLSPSETLAGKTLGIIGAGNVGSILYRWAKGLGMNVIVNDPPRQESGDTSIIYSSLTDIAKQSDFISIHTPLTIEGCHATYHLLNDDFLGSTIRHPMVINAARGPVADTAALKRAFNAGTISALAIDCWENEPHIDTELLSMATVATPHIAGYSKEGKIRATSMVLDSLAAHLSANVDTITADELKASLPHVNPVPETISIDEITYDITADTNALKLIPLPDLATSFESLRNNYNLRPEPTLPIGNHSQQP